MRSACVELHRLSVAVRAAGEEMPLLDEAMAAGVALVVAIMRAQSAGLPAGGPEGLDRAAVETALERVKDLALTRFDSLCRGGARLN